MAGQYDKSNILGKLKQKATSKGFNLNPDRSKLPKGTPTVLELLDLVAETISEILSQDSQSANLVAGSFKIGPSGLQKAVAFKDATIKADSTTDPQFFAWFETFTSFLSGVYPEPGMGSPSVFAMALKAMIAAKPTSLTGKITEGSGSIKVTT